MILQWYKNFFFHFLKFHDSNQLSIFLFNHLHIIQINHKLYPPPQDGYLNLNVITSTQFHRLSADHHGNAPYANLFDALSTTTYDHLWNSGGSTTALPNAGSRGVFWNVRRVGSSQVPPAPYFARSADRYKYPSIVMVPGEV